MRKYNGGLNAYFVGQLLPLDMFSSIKVGILKELTLTKKGFLWAQIFLSYSYVFAISDFTSIRWQDQWDGKQDEYTYGANLTEEEQKELVNPCK